MMLALGCDVYKLTSHEVTFLDTYRENFELKHLCQGPNLQRYLRACISVELEFWKSQNTVTHRTHTYFAQASQHSQAPESLP